MAGVRTAIFRLTRRRFHPEDGGGTLFFTSDGGDRRHPPKIWQPRDVPEFEGDRASFLAEWVRGDGWKIVRRLDEDRADVTG